MINNINIIKYLYIIWVFYQNECCISLKRLKILYPHNFQYQKATKVPKQKLKSNYIHDIKNKKKIQICLCHGIG